MIRINVKQVLKQIEEDKHKPKDPIKISIKKVAPAKDLEVDRSESNPEVQVSTDLSSQAWEEFNIAKIERAKLSNEIPKLIAAGATTSELARHYDKIIGCEPELKELYEHARHIEQYGSPPEMKKENDRPVDIFSLKDERRKLIDKRSKLSTKLKLALAKNPDRISKWQIELDIANANYTRVDEQIKKLEGKA